MQDQSKSILYLTRNSTWWLKVSIIKKLLKIWKNGVNSFQEHMILLKYRNANQSKIRCSYIQRYAYKICLNNTQNDWCNEIQKLSQLNNWYVIRLSIIYVKNALQRQMTKSLKNDYVFSNLVFRSWYYETGDWVVLSSSKLLETLL